MKPQSPPARASLKDRLRQFFPTLLGAFLALSLLKFGNPAILDKLITQPANFYEWLLTAWPIHLSYWLLAALALCGALCVLWRSLKPDWLATIPLVWLAWQLVASTRTVNTELTLATMKYFAACVVCFYLGYLVLGRERRLTGFWLALLAGCALMLWSGVDQRFGGLEATRQHFYLYVYPQLTNPPPELLKRMASDRIFATLFYPNALAGAVLLLLPALLAFVWSLEGRLTAAARGFLMGLLTLAALGCLYWSGSKGGWLLMLAVGLVALWRTLNDRRLKLALVAAVLVLGLAGFAWRYAAFFQRGATSVGARFDYWQAALTVTRENPLLGTGPGTFYVNYQRIKKPESEMSRLVHNDYLQQACDSGLPGLLSYALFVGGVLVVGWRKLASRFDWLTFGVWLGLLGFSLQGLLEFGLYIPALAWPAFVLMGWLLAKE